MEDTEHAQPPRLLPSRGVARAMLTRELRRAASRTAQLRNALADPGLSRWLAAVDAEQPGLTDAERVRLARVARRAAS